MRKLSARFCNKRAALHCAVRKNHLSDSAKRLFLLPEIPRFAGAVAVAPEQQLCGPVVGEIGVYVFRVDERLDGAFYTENDALKMAYNLANFQIQMIPLVLQESAKVEDRRARFF